MHIQNFDNNLISNKQEMFKKSDSTRYLQNNISIHSKVDITYH